MSSALNRGRAAATPMLQNAGMTESDWRHRLEDAIARDGRSLREVSLTAGLSPSYLHGILRDGKEPTVDRFMKVCAVLGVSSASLLSGVTISPATEEILQALEGDPDGRAAMLGLLRRRRD